MTYWYDYRCHDCGYVKSCFDFMKTPDRKMQCPLCQSFDVAIAPGEQEKANALRAKGRYA